MCLRGNADRRKTPVQPCIDEKFNSVKEGMHDITNKKIELFLDFVHKRF